jgi:hypothetical protein
MGSELLDLIRSQHAELRSLLARLERQPAYTELMLGPQVRARERAFQAVQHAYLAQQSLRLRHLWPALGRAWPDGGSYADQAWAQTRSVQARMAKRQWFGERDETKNRLEAEIAWGVRRQLVLEERQLGRLERAVETSAIDGATLVRRLGGSRPTPTRPHPDVPLSRRLAAALQAPLALADRLVDRTSIGPEPGTS